MLYLSHYTAHSTRDLISGKSNAAISRAHARVPRVMASRLNRAGILPRYLLSLANHRMSAAPCNMRRIFRSSDFAFPPTERPCSSFILPILGPHVISLIRKFHPPSRVNSELSAFPYFLIFVIVIFCPL